jgi:hypothetical protein
MARHRKTVWEGGNVGAESRMFGSEKEKEIMRCAVKLNFD